MRKLIPTHTKFIFSPGFNKNKLLPESLGGICATPYDCIFVFRAKML